MIGRETTRVVLGALLLRLDPALRAEVNIAEVALETGLGRGEVLTALAVFDANDAACVEVSPDAQSVVVWLRRAALAEIGVDGMLAALRAWRTAWARSSAARWTAAA